MLDLRLYRLAFLAVVPAVVVALFSVDTVAKPLPPGIATTGFDGRGAAGFAREVEALGETRTLGSPADARAANLVAKRFELIPVGTVTRTPVTSGGLTPDPESETVAVSMPGESSEAILVVARRTAASPAGRLATATATGVLVQLAGLLGEARREHELILASVPDAEAATALARQISLERPVLGAIAIDDARGVRTGEILLHRAPGDLAASSTLAETAQEVIGGEGVPVAGAEPPLGQIARLALGVSFGTQARLLAEGIDAVALSATGELPPREGDGAPTRVLSTPLEILGEITLRVVQALDAAPELPDEEGSYVRFGDSVVPGWAFSLVALALLFPALLAAVDALARAARRGRRASAALQSVLVRSLPFGAALVLLYLMGATGIVPNPGFPFDPAEFSLGGGELVALGAAALVAAAIAFALRVAAVPARYGAATLAAAAGLIGVLGVFGVWIENPFAALLVLPLAHVWVIAAGERAPSRVAALAAPALAIAPICAAALYVSAELELGGDAPWTLAMLITGGQLRVAQALIGCVLAGVLLSVAVASTRRAPR